MKFVKDGSLYRSQDGRFTIENRPYASARTGKLNQSQWILTDTKTSAKNGFCTLRAAKAFANFYIEISSGLINALTS